MEFDHARDARYEALSRRTESRLDLPYRGLRAPAALLVQFHFHAADVWLRRRAVDGTRGQSDDRARGPGKGRALPAKHRAPRGQGPGDVGLNRGTKNARSTR